MIVQWESRKRTVTIIAGRHAAGMTVESELALVDNTGGGFEPAPELWVEPDSGSMGEPWEPFEERERFGFC